MLFKTNWKTNLIYTFLIIFLTSLNTYAQNQKNIDSLKKALQYSKEDTSKIKILNAISWETKEYNSEESLKYASEALKLSEKLNYQYGIAYAYHNLGKLFQLSFNHDTALFLYKKALLIFQKIDFSLGLISTNTYMATIYGKKAIYDTALFYFANAMKRAQIINDESSIPSILNNMGLIYSRFDKNIPDSAIKYFSLSLKFAEKAGNIEAASAAATNLSIVYNYQYQYRKALNILKNVLPLVEQSDLTIKKATVYSQIASCYKHLGITDSTMLFNLKCLPIFERYKKFDLLAYVYNNLGNYYHLKSLYDSSILFYKKCLEVERNIVKENYSIAACISNIGDVYKDKGDLDSAIESYIQSLRIFQDIKDSTEIGARYFELSDIYIIKKEYNKAIQYCELALSNGKSIKDKGLFFTILLKLGWLYREINKDEKAINYLTQALNVAPKVESIEDTRIFLESISKNFFRIKNYSASLFYIQRALDISELIGNLNGKADALLMIGKNYNELNKTDSCIIYYKRAIDISKKINNKENEYECLINLSDVYSKKGDYKKSLEYYQQYTEVKDSVINEKSNNKIAELEIQYETEKKDREIENLTKDAKIKDLEIQQKKQELQAQQLEQEKKQQAIDLLTANKKIQEISLAKKEKEVADLLKDRQIKNLLIQQNNQQIHAQLMEQEKKQQAINLLLASKQIQQLDLDKKENNIKLLEKTKQLQQSEISRRTSLYIFSLLALIVAVGLFSLYFRYQQAKKKNLTEKRIAQLEQKALQLQMNPHFIFNSLNSIGDFIMHHEAASAQNFLARFSKLTRAVLEASKETFIPLEKELEILNNYLFLEQVRFNQCFDFNIELGKNINPEITLLPPMLIQPFVENAILHGIAPLSRRGNITISLDMNESNKMVCQVKDDDIGINESLQKKQKQNFNKANHRSIAMENTKERLKVLGELYSTNLKNEINDISTNVSSGTEVKFEIPVKII